MNSCGRQTWQGKLLSMSSEDGTVGSDGSDAQIKVPSLGVLRTCREQATCKRHPQQCRTHRVLCPALLLLIMFVIKGNGYYNNFSLSLNETATLFTSCASPFLTNTRSHSDFNNVVLSPPIISFFF